MTQIVNLSRRGFIKGSAAVGGGLVLGVALPALDALGNPVQPPPGQLNGFVKIGTDGNVTITVTHAEMGQGIQTALPMIVAEELDVEWSKISVVRSSARPDGGTAPAAAGTGGSRSVRANFEMLSIAGAAARDMLRQAAANRWRVPVEECMASQGVISHVSGKSATYGSLVLGASYLSPPATVTLKDPSQWRLLGRPINRLDAAEKAEGTAEFGVDVALPDMLVGTVRHCPVWGGTLTSVDNEPALAVNGVREVITTDNSVIVVADGYWQAKKGLDALSPEWSPGSGAKNSSAEIDKAMQRAVKRKGAVVVDRGNMDQALRHSAKRVEAVYEVPFLHHATMEPMNATAWVQGNSIQVWAPIQGAGRARHSIASEFGFAEENVNVHVTYLGGGFGRRIGMGFIRPAVIAAQKMGRPVKVIWSREEDMAQPMMRPAAVARMRAGLNKPGLPVAWDSRLVVPSISEQLVPGRVRNGVDQISVHGAEVLPYTIDHQRLEYAMPDTGVPLGFWRAVPHSYNAFFVESFVDEIAAASGTDPVELRSQIMRPDSRHRAVLDRVAAEARWDAPPKSGRFRGIAVHESFGSIVGQVVEITVSDDKAIKVEKVVAAVDCGIAVNPRTIEAQIEGSIAYALTAAMYGRIDIEGGAAVQRNFDSYRMVQMTDMPKVDVHILENGPIGGIGEPGVPPLAPALTNAIFAATGERIRKLPLIDSGFSFA
ncbi:MAG: molybdopterin cofactor-binding domain-containing protein [Alphaproteobacteria bacterium]